VVTDVGRFSLELAAPPSQGRGPSILNFRTSYIFPHPWSKIYVTQMLTRDLFAVANMRVAITFAVNWQIFLMILLTISEQSIQEMNVSFQYFSLLRISVN